MLVYRYRQNAATYDAPTFTTKHRDRDVTVADAPDGVWQLLLTEGWLIMPPSATAPKPTVAPPTFPEFTGTPLPADHPNRANLIRAGIETLEQLHEYQHADTQPAEDA
jgi:hypothetical protein